MARQYLAKSTFLSCALLLSLLAAIPLAAEGQTTPDLRKQAGASGDDPFAVPDGDSNHLVEFIRKMRTRRPRARTRREYNEQKKKAAHAIITAADKVIASNPPERTVIEAIAAKLEALKILADYRKSSAVKALEDYVKIVAHDTRPAVAVLARPYQLLAKAKTWVPASDEERAAFIEDAKQAFSENIDMARMLMIMGIGRTLERRCQKLLAAGFYSAVAPAVMKSKNQRVADYGRKFEGIARRLLLVGQEMELKGTTLDGTELDWSAYKGKVVLVDFWATWCGPCRAELPNVKRNYERYHSKGFDVVGISLDSDKRKVEEFVKARGILWVTLFSNDKKATAWNHPMAVYYGITAIPTAILVGKDGKVVTLNARGGELTRRLRILLGNGESKVSQAQTTYEDAAGNKRIFNDAEINRRLVEYGHKLVDAGRTVPASLLMNQLNRQTCSLRLAPRSRTRMSPAAIYKSKIRSIIVVGTVYKCERCTKWHSITSTGFLVSQDGAFVLACHSFNNLKKKQAAMVAMTIDGAVFPVKEVLAADRKNDVAIARLDPGRRRFTPLAVSTLAPVGSGVTVISHPSKRPYTLSTGVVSRYYRHGRHEGTAPVRLGITADFAKGSSGAPVFNEYGDVVGLVSTTSSVYYEEKDGVQKNLQMVFWQCVPAEAILRLLQK